MLRGLRSTACVIGILMLTVGCGTSFVGATPSPAADEVNEAAAALLPDAIKQSKVLKAESVGEFPPFESVGPDGQLFGIDIDLTNALAARLGLKVEWTVVQFPTFIPSVINGRFDIAAGQLNATPEREAVVDLLYYYRTADQLLVRKGNPTGIPPTDLCGRTIALLTASAQATYLPRISQQCEQANKPPITFVNVTDTANAVLAIQSGRAEATVTTAATAAYTAKSQPAVFEVVPGVLPGTDQGFAGYAIAKGNAGLSAALKAALNDLIKNGRYRAILEKYGVADRAITTAMINGKP